MKLFDIINHISADKKEKWEEIGDSPYNSYMINRGLSYYSDCIMYANEMNLKWQLPKKMQYDFLFNVVDPKKKRFSKWATSKKDKQIDLISKYYNISLRKAQSIYPLLSEDTLSNIEKMLDTGGTK